MSPPYPLFSYPSNPTTGITPMSQVEPLDLSVKTNNYVPSNPTASYNERINLEEKLSTLLSYYESLSKENSLLRAQENELLVEIQAVRNALLIPPSVVEEEDDDGTSSSTSSSFSSCSSSSSSKEVPVLDLRFAVSKGLKARPYVKRRQSSLSTITSSSSEEDSPPPNESKINILVKKKKKMEQNKLASRRFRERKKAVWSQTVQEADRLGAVNKELKNKASELELKIKWIKEALRKCNNDSNNNSSSSTSPTALGPSMIVSTSCNTHY